MIRIGIIDKNNLFRTSLKSYINGIKSCQVNLDCSDLKKIDVRLIPEMINVLIIDINRFSNSDWTCFQRIAQKFPDIQILVLSNDFTKDVVMELLGIGVSGIYSKEICPKLFKDIIVDFGRKERSLDVKIGAIVRERIMAN